MVAGVLGLIALGIWRMAQASSRGRLGPEVVPPSFVATACAALFTTAAVVLGGPGLFELLIAGRASGAGSLVTAGLVSGFAAIAFWVILIRRLREVSPAAVPG